jgi:transcriptional regulator with XRE-family HTH domain
METRKAVETRVNDTRITVRKHNREDFGQLVKALRETHGHKQNWYGKKLGRSYDWLSRIERAHHKSINLQALRGLENILGLEEGKLVSWAKYCGYSFIIPKGYTVSASVTALVEGYCNSEKLPKLPAKADDLPLFEPKVSTVTTGIEVLESRCLVVDGWTLEDCEGYWSLKNDKNGKVMPILHSDMDKILALFERAQS